MTRSLGEQEANRKRAAEIAAARNEYNQAAYAMDDIGYANFSANYDGGETIEKAIPYFSLHVSIRF